jgi:pectinesterase
VFRAVVVLLLPALLDAQSVSLRAENTLPFTRTDETMGLKWADVTAKLSAATPSKVLVRDGASMKEIVSQVVDNDGDGTMDELIFQSTFAPGEVKNFTIEASTPSAKNAKARVYAAHMMPRDDVAWENDRIAYRIYGQGLWKVDSLLSSGIDVWVKRTRDPIVEKFYAAGHDAYHRDTGEGADFFDVGQTLGAGGTAIWKNDSLYRAWNFKSQRIIANGPVRAIFELQYQPWEAPGVRVTETKRIAIDAGANVNRITSIFRAENGVTDIPWATGLVKRKGVVGSMSKTYPWAWLTLWGAVSPKDGGHGDLGTTVLLPRDAVLDWKENSNHYLAISRARSGQPVTYYMGAGWTDSGDYRDVRDWWSYLDQLAQRLATPIAIQFK